MAEFKQKALHWADKFQQVAYYEPNQIKSPHQGFQNFLAVSNNFLAIDLDNALVTLQAEVDNLQQTLCCIISYELKNQIEPLTTRHTDRIQFPVLHYFYPDITIKFSNNYIEIYSESDICYNVFKEIIEIPVNEKISGESIQLKERVLKKDYIQRVNEIKKSILEGDV
ncbi:MAG: hypothetical protein M3142_04420, partial [Bacteroidota bacterium]|nr:hypothetical protein [Bacteroidota bacterium]